MTNEAPPPQKSSRRRSREFALQGIYEWLVSARDPGAVQAHIEEIKGFKKCDVAHFEALLHGAIDHAEPLRAEILPHLDRSFREISPVEHAVLLIGAYELAHHQEVPYRVVMNEAVELAKSYGGAEGYKYVNGVLDKLAGKLRPVECAR